ncbi:MAG: 2-hydroxyacid dehydrogenase [Roseburia sp.]|nr:2-hydroxyacid dehydrogenase [Roseburia sp.]MCM1280113.1 2-hydroxyacid dehydrogenase [Robinsoniella sp.]
MKIAFYSTKPYDRIWFEPLAKEYGFSLHFMEVPCNEETIFMAAGYDAICIFVNDYVNKEMIEKLYEMKVKAILLRSAGYNHVDIKAAEDKIAVLRVPSYSPEAVAEYAAALLLSVNRFTHKAYGRTRDFNMSINGLMGRDLNNKIAGVIGTGKIGQAMIRILEGFGMSILAYDPYPVKGLDVEYVSLEELMKKADVISLHCPLTKETKHIINKKTIAKMKDNVYLINTSRGALIDTEALIEGLLSKKFAGVGLDVYEEEEGVFYEDRSNDIMEDELLARLTTFPNVIITSHMGFFTREAMQSIAIETLENAYALENGLPLINKVV